MSFNGVPQMKSFPAHVPKVPEMAPKPVALPGSPERASKEIINKEAEALFSGTKTLMELTYKYNDTIISQIIKKNNELNSDISYFEDKKDDKKIEIPPKTEVLKIMAEFKKLPKTDQSEQDFFELINKLRRHPEFERLYDQTKLLMKNNPDMADIYEAKAVQDFVEFYPELMK